MTRAVIQSFPKRRQVGDTPLGTLEEAVDYLRNLSNVYAEALGPLFEEASKSVLAAIAVAALTSGGDYLEEAAWRLAREWVILHGKGIVRQRPPPRVRALARQAEVFAARGREVG